MKTSTVLVGLLLAFLLFTPQGQFIGEIALLSAMEATKPVPDPAKVAAEDATFKACVEARNAARKAALAKAKGSALPGFDEYFELDRSPHC
jgi:hypothetical protein